MIARNDPAPEEQPKPDGVLGDGALQPGKGNMALVRRAIREDWPIPPELRAKLVAQMGKVLEKSEDERNQVAAAKVLVAADAINAKREGADAAAEKGDSGTQVNVQVNIADMRQQMLADPEYIELQRRKALGQAGVSKNGNGNGHHGSNGNGHHV